jgi:hypothetical protein
MQCCTCKSRGKNNVDTEGLTEGESDGEDFKFHKEDKAVRFRRDETIDNADLESAKLKPQDSDR